MRNGPAAAAGGRRCRTVQSARRRAGRRWWRWRRTMTDTFSQPVTNPVLQIDGLGGATTGAQDAEARDPGRGRTQLTRAGGTSLGGPNAAQPTDEHGWHCGTAATNANASTACNTLLTRRRSSRPGGLRQHPGHQYGHVADVQCEPHVGGRQRILNPASDASAGPLRPDSETSGPYDAGHNGVQHATTSATRYVAGVAAGARHRRTTRAPDRNGLLASGGRQRHEHNGDGTDEDAFTTLPRYRWGVRPTQRTDLRSIEGRDRLRVDRPRQG